jgi:ribosome-associated heat shock protein Hsp15
VSPEPEAPDPVEPGQRIDKWLWAARFFKTRSLAAQAVSGGKVQVDGGRVKPARRIRPGARLRVRRGVSEWEVEVRGLAAERRPAPEAASLYEETPESLERRRSEAQRRGEAEGRRGKGLGRPTKRERRTFERLRDPDSR